MKLAVRKEQGEVPGGGYHYMLFPKKMESDKEANVMSMMGYIIVEVSDERGERMLMQGMAALEHQMEVAVVTEDSIRKAGPK